MNYLPDANWHKLLADLVAAAHHPADPKVAIAELICGFVAPHSARAEIEADERAAFARYLKREADGRAAFARYCEREIRTPSGRLDMDAIIAEARAAEAKAT